MRLNELKPAAGSKKKRKRVGCGPGSGHGKTARRGHKGTQSRIGNTLNAHYEGGQMPLQRRLPKRGFINIFRVEYQVINVSDLDRFDDNATVDIDALLERGLIRHLNNKVSSSATASSRSRSRSRFTPAVPARKKPWRRRAARSSWSGKIEFLAQPSAARTQ